jgi:uncharacterized membrane protein (UPF0182 family)
VDSLKNRQRAGQLVIGIAIVVLVLVGPALLSGYVDWLWFGELGQRRVFWSILGARVGLGLAFGLALALLAYVNVAIARRNSPEYTPYSGPAEWAQAAAELGRKLAGGALVAGALVVGLIGGIAAASRWDDWLRFQHAQKFGSVDPLFKLDLGYFIFQYPFLLFVYGWLLVTLAVVLIATAGVYYLNGAFAVVRGRLNVAPQVRAHLSVLMGLLMLVKAWGYQLEQHGLVLKDSDSGLALFGASYADAGPGLFALRVLLVIAVAAAIGFLVNARLRAVWLPVAALGIMVVANVTVGKLYPGLVQQFVVRPDEQNKEAPYIRHFLEGTRQGYGLGQVQSQDYNVGKPLRAADLSAERPTLENIRLWDYRVLKQTFQRLQGLRSYYDVSDVDIDRYRIGGRYREVMLAPREMVIENLGQRSWVNNTIQYTHGYGMVMTPVGEADESGRPTWLVQDLPLRATPGLEITRPQIYYGMRRNPEVVAPSKTPEFDFQGQQGSRSSVYAGNGGIPLSSTWLRTLFSLNLGEANFLISDQIQDRSKILIRRNVQDRIAALAPFLSYDYDPYLTLVDGKLVWIQDAYTVAGTFPYSEPSYLDDARLLVAGVSGQVTEHERRVNYIRNSVKITVDAYTGEVTLWAMDPQEPILKAYRAAFPGLFRDGATMPAALREHIRYPEALFEVQTRKWTRFHVTDPAVYYARSDEWEIPKEQLSGEDAFRASTVAMDPYYVVMRLPGEKTEEFVLIRPFRTKAGSAMAGWMCGRCDGASYGQVRLYRFPASTQVQAPDQVEPAMLANSQVSTQQSLLGQRGTRVRFGNLLVLPVAGSLLYVKPFYVESTQQNAAGEAAGIPQLEYVILAEERGGHLKVVMKPTLREALAELVGGEAPPPETTPASAATGGTEAARVERPGTVGTPAALAAEADAAFTRADQALRKGDLAEFERQYRKARDAVRRLRTPAPSSASPSD